MRGEEEQRCAQYGRDDNSSDDNPRVETPRSKTNYERQREIELLLDRERPCHRLRLPSPRAMVGHPEVLQVKSAPFYGDAGIQVRPHEDRKHSIFCELLDCHSSSYQDEIQRDDAEEATNVKGAEIIRRIARVKQDSADQEARKNEEQVDACPREPAGYLEKTPKK